MPFEETLKRALDSLARELTSAVQAEREEAVRRARRAADEAAAASIADAQTVAEQRGLTAGREEGLAEGRRQGFHQGRQEGYEAGKSEGYQLGKEEGFLAGQEALQTAGADGATAERLVDAMRAIDRSRSLSEVLDTLAGCAGRETTRAAVFRVNGDQLRGWRFLGFGPGLDTGRVFETTLAEAGIIAEAIGSDSVVARQCSPTALAPRFADLAFGCDMLAAPIAVGGRTVAVLYADQQPITGQAAAVRSAWQPSLEVLARHAGRCLESITAIRAAQLLTAPPVPSEPALSDDEQAARRYARLLVSEIKLYHEADVVAGRRERDLASRLGGEIARARALYEQRVPAHVHGRSQYFQDELVRTLAEGDSRLLNVQVTS